jgi:hypothetical protein
VECGATAKFSTPSDDNKPTKEKNIGEGVDVGAGGGWTPRKICFV